MNLGTINFNKQISKPWGWERIFIQTENYVGKIIHIYPNHRLSLQYHETKEETILVRKGTLKVEYGESGGELSISLVEPDEVFHIKPGLVHRMSSYTSDSVEVLEISTNHLDDVVRIFDDYKRS